MVHVAKFDISSSGGDVSVSLTLHKPPIIGKKPLEIEEKPIACQWTLQKKDTNRFLNSLKYRKIVSSLLVHCVWIVLTAYSILFSPSMRPSWTRRESCRLLTRSVLILPPTRDLRNRPRYAKPLLLCERYLTLNVQEKAIAIAKRKDELYIHPLNADEPDLVWDGPEQSQGAADYGTTSPLMHSIFPPKSDELNELPILEAPSVFIDDNGNFTNQPAQPPPPRVALDSSPLMAVTRPKATKEVLLKKSLSLLMSAKQRSQEETDDSQPTTARRRRSEHVIVSDHESEPDADDQDYAPSPTPTRRRSPRLSRAPTLAKIPEGNVAPTAVAVGKNKVVPLAKEVKPRPTIRTRSAHSKENESPVKPGTICLPTLSPPILTHFHPFADPAKPSNTMKRRASSDLVVGDDDDEPPLPPPKKPRLSPTKESVNEKSKPRPTTRYKSKMKGSTPAVVDLAHDDDEPPKAIPETAARATGKKKAVEPQRTGKRTTQMKDRSGKAKARAAPVPVNKRTTRATANVAKRGADMEDVKPALTIANAELEVRSTLLALICDPFTHAMISVSSSRFPSSRVGRSLPSWKMLLRIPRATNPRKRDLPVISRRKRSGNATASWRTLRHRSSLRLPDRWYRRKNLTLLHSTMIELRKAHSSSTLARLFLLWSKPSRLRIPWISSATT